MIMKFAAAAVIIFFAGCNSSVDPGPVNGYPAIQGNTWNYNAFASLTNFRPLQTGASFRDTSIMWRSIVRAEGSDTLLDSIATLKFTTRDTGAANSSGVQHYIVHGDTLLLFAYYNPSLALPKQGSGLRYTVAGRQFPSLEALMQTMSDGMVGSDTLWVELNPPPVLIFPLTVGREWQYRHTPFIINKKIAGTENVSTALGDIACYKIQWTWDINADGKPDSLLTGTDYVNNKGLIKRTFILNNVTISMAESPDPIGTVDLKNEWVVSSFEGALYPKFSGR